MLALAGLLGLTPAAPAEAQQPTRGAVLIGGHSTTEANLQQLRPNVEGLGFAVGTVELARQGSLWPGTGSNVTSAQAVQAEVDQLLADNPGVTSVDLFAISQGAPVARHYVKFLDVAPEVDGLISFSGVNLGVPVDWLLFGTCYLVGAQGCIDTAQGSDFLAGVNASPPTPGGIDYYHVYTEDWEPETLLPTGHTFTARSAQDLCGDGYAVGHADFSNPALLELGAAALERRQPVTVC